MSIKPLSNVVTVNATFSSTISNSEYVFICNPDNSVKAIQLPGTNTGNIILRNNLKMILQKNRSVVVAANGTILCTAIAAG